VGRHERDAHQKTERPEGDNRDRQTGEIEIYPKMCYILQIDRHAFEQEEMMKISILRMMVWFFFASLVLHG
jgi:hypothetical protein